MKKVINQTRQIGLALSIVVFLSTVATASALAEEQKPMSQILITNVNVFDGKNEKLADNASVLVEGNLIKRGLKWRPTTTA